MVTGHANTGRRRSPARRLLGGLPLALAALALSSCSALGGGSETAKNPTDAPGTGPLNITLPSDFTTDGSWTANESSRVYTLSAGSGVFLDVYAGGDSDTAPDSDTPTPPEPDASAAPGQAPRTDGSRLIARRGNDGSLLWTSVPLSILTDPQPPLLRTVATTNGEYVVVVRRGVTPDLPLQTGANAMVLDSFPLAAPGGEVKPLQHRVIPVDDPESATAVVGDGGVLVQDGEADDFGQLAHAQTWNPITGALTNTAATTSNQTCPDGSACTVTASPVLATASGVLSVDDSGCGNVDYTDSSCFHAFGVTGVWNSAQHAPAGHPLGVPIAVTAHTVIAAWWKPVAEDTPPAVVYTVQGLDDGNVIASVTCASAISLDGSTSTLPLVAAESPQRRYLVAGPLLFDLSARTGHCLPNNGQAKPLALSTVDDDGIAYGTVSQDDAERDTLPATVRVPVATGKTEVLPSGTSVPLVVSDRGYALFRPLTPEGDDPSSSIGIYRHATATPAPPPPGPTP